MNNKTQDKQIWVRMSLDLVALRELIGSIGSEARQKTVWRGSFPVRKCTYFILWIKLLSMLLSRSSAP